jgi:hypothetical protein
MNRREMLKSDQVTVASIADLCPPSSRPAGVAEVVRAEVVRTLDAG